MTVKTSEASFGTKCTASVWCFLMCDSISVKFHRLKTSHGPAVPHRLHGAAAVIGLKDSKAESSKLLS